MNQDLEQPLAHLQFRKELAEGLTNGANICTKLRSDSAPLVGGMVALTGVFDRIAKESDVQDGLLTAMTAHERGFRHSVTAAAAFVAATDMEGGLFRIARSIFKDATNPGGGERDHRADKKYLYYLLGGLTIKRLLQDDHKSAAVMASVLGINLARDAAMKHERSSALSRNPAANTDAIMVNKLKTALLFSGAILATTEWSERGIGRKVTHGMLLSGSALGIAGYRRFRKQLRSQQPA